MLRLPSLVAALVGATCFTSLLPLPATAQAIRSPSRFSLGNEGLPGVFSTHSALGLQAGEFGFNAMGMAGRDVAIIRDTHVTGPDGRESPFEDAFQVYSQAALAVGLGCGIDVGLSLPYYYDYFPGIPGHAEDWGAGDFELAGKAGLTWHRAASALFASVSFPTSEETHGFIPREINFSPTDGELPGAVTHPYGSSQARGSFGAALTFDLAPRRAEDPAHEAAQALIHFNLEGQRPFVSPQSQAAGLVRASMAAEGGWLPWLRFSLEYHHEKRVESAFDWNRSSAHANRLGAAVSLTAQGFTVRVGGLLAPGEGNPYQQLVSRDGMRMAYRPYPAASAFVAVSWQGFPWHHDQDGDGLPDRADLCPFRAEDRDGFQDEDGCPDNDNDGDGLFDSSDQCPNQPEDRDGFQDIDGCPDPDNDRDGIADSADACVNEAEDRDGFEDGDGCPEFDNDKDGIPDAADKCPSEPESKNGLEDTDGCPEADSDRDGIPDKFDRCPNEAEIINFFQDTDGCPDEKPEPIRSTVLPGVTFKPGTAELAATSYPELDTLAARMLAYPGTQIEIQGHLDDRSPRPQAVSEAMAQAVAGYLANRGVEPRRMKPAGYGETRPVASNRTAHGRQANRRIEIIRLN